MRRGTVLGWAIGAVVLGTLITAATLWPRGAEGQRGPAIGQPAPEIVGGPWINSEPLSPGSLRGRVALVEFWTYG